MRKTKLLSIILVLSLVCLLVATGCSQKSEAPANTNEQTEPQSNENSELSEQAKELEGELILYHAGSLSVPLQELEKEFEKMHPGVDVKRTSGGSRTIARKVVELGDKVDILCSADYTVIDTLMIPDYANWNALFAENSMVIMYSVNSKFADEITSDNWYEILLKEDVNFGHSEPNADPCGYRSVLLWQLAEDYYNIEGLNDQIINARKEKNIRPKSVELISMLETGALDYAFEYESVAIQHSKMNPDLKYVKLPVEINLSSIDQKDFYEKAIIELDGKEPGTTVTKKGQPIVYSLTMPNTGKNNEIAIEFLKFLFDREQGMKLLQESGQPILEEITVFGDENLPEELLSVIE